MSKTQQKEETYSVYDKLESARFSSHELNEKFLDLQRLLLKIKKKNKENEKPSNVLCVKLEIFDYFLKKLEFILHKFNTISTTYEEIINDFSSKTFEISQESSKMIKDLQNQHKCDIIRLELNYNKLLETQALSFHKKENESIESFKIISQDLEKTFKFCKNDFEETTMNFHEIKQAFLMSKTKHLSLLNEFDYDLKDSIKKIEEKQGNLPFKVKTLRNNEDSSKIEVNKSNIMKSFLTNINDSSMIDRKKLIALKDIMNKNQCKSKKAEKNLNESEIELEISVFLANQLNHSQEESRLNISMTKDEGKWDPALDSEKSEDSEYSELRKAFEIFDSLNLFESENLNVLQNFSDKCKENKNMNSIDKSMFKELIIQLLKIQKERKIVKLTENNIFKNSSPLKTKGNNNNNNSNEISPNNYSNDLPNNSHLNLTHIENSEPLNDEINESKQNFELKAENDNIQSKKTKNKDLSLSDLILDSSFLSPKTASNLKYEEFGLKNMRKEEKYAALQKNNMILIEEASSNKKSLEEKSNSINESQKFKKTMITNRNLETCGIYSDEDKSNKYDEILSQMKEKIRKDKLLSFRLKDSQPKNERTKYSHNKHNSEILRSTPSGLFLNPLNNSNSNSETKLSSNIENISFNSKLPAKFNRNNSSLGTAPTQKNVSQSNIMQRIMKRNPLQTNSLFFSNQTQTKIMTADFNKEIGFLQNIICFNKHDGGNTIRSEPIIGPIQKEFTHNFSKLFNNNNKENKKFNNFDPMFNCSFPGGRKINKNKQQIFVKQNGSCIAERKNPKKKVVNKSMEINDGWGSINSSQLNFANLKMSYSKKNLKNLI